MHKLGLILVIIGTCLVALDIALGYGARRTTVARPFPLTRLGVLLIGIGVIIGVDPVT